MRNQLAGGRMSGRDWLRIFVGQSGCDPLLTSGEVCGFLAFDFTLCLF